MKPILIDGKYYTFELVKKNPSEAKTYKEAKAEILPVYIEEMKKRKLQELAQNSLDTFTGKTTGFITLTDADKIEDLSKAQASEFLQKLFTNNKKSSFIVLNSGKIVLFHILEQKLLTNKHNDLSNSMTKIKSGIFNEALIKTLEKKYPTEIFIQGL
jgi:peptidyl-prolyl cis-trans isomerase D